MASSDLIAYRASIFGFLKTLTIKNNWIVEVYNQNVELAGYAVDESQPATWKYYMNIQGQYHESDTVMTVLSRDTQEEINFTVENLQVHARTRAAYLPGQPGHTTLCKRYPDQVDLIKNILFPVSDFSAAYAAEDISLLAWGDGYLEEAETQSVIKGVNDFLTYVSARWYMTWMDYEPYYYPVFWASLWQHLFSLVSTIRVQNIHTAAAHTFHIWEYLTSLGIDDYRDILSRKQTLFLYRNMRYITQNRGRQSNLVLLVNKLLSEQAVAMVNKVLYQNTLDGAEECRWLPDIVSEPVETDRASALTLPSPQSVQDITLQLSALGVETNTSLTYIDELRRKLAATRANRLRTKLLEIRPILRDRKYAEMLGNFIFDNVVSAVTSGKYTTQVVYKDETTGLTVSMTPKEALALFYYAAWRRHGEAAPVDLPSVYTPIIGAFKSDLTVNSIPDQYNWRGSVYNLSMFANKADMILGAKPQLGIYIGPDELATDIGNMFGAIVRVYEMQRFEGSAPGVYVLNKAGNAMRNRLQYAISLDATSTTYADWLADASHASIAGLISAYEALSDPVALYDALASAIIELFIPTTNEVLNLYRDDEDARAFYGRIKDLFVQLCSYNVLFLDTERASQRWLMMPRILSNAPTMNVDLTTLADLSFRFKSEGVTWSVEDSIILGKNDNHMASAEIVYTVERLMTQVRFANTEIAVATKVLHHPHLAVKPTSTVYKLEGKSGLNMNVLLKEEV